MKFNKIDLNDGDVILREEGFHLMRVHEDFALAILYDIPLHDDPEPETIVQSMDQAALRSEISAGRTFIICSASPSRARTTLLRRHGWMTTRRTPVDVCVHAKL